MDAFKGVQGPPPSQEEEQGRKEGPARRHRGKIRSLAGEMIDKCRDFSHGTFSGVPSPRWAERLINKELFTNVSDVCCHQKSGGSLC